MKHVIGRAMCAAPWLVLTALPAAGQDARQDARREEQQVHSPEASEARGGRRYEAARPPAPETTTAVVSGALAPPDSAVRAPAEGSALDAARWVAFDEAEAGGAPAARVLLPDGERSLRPGDVIGRDRVTSIRERQIVLERAAAPGENGIAAVVVADFGPDGTARVRVLWKRVPKTPLIFGGAR